MNKYNHIFSFTSKKKVFILEVEGVLLLRFMCTHYIVWVTLETEPYQIGPTLTKMYSHKYIAKCAREEI